MLSEDDLLHWLVASYMGVAPTTFVSWLNHFDSIQNLFAASFLKLKSLGLKDEYIEFIKNPNWDAAEKDLAWSQQSHCAVIAKPDACYPELLRQLPDAPLVLYVEGQKQILTKPQIAMVGTRNPTPAGREMAEAFAFSLAKNDVCVTSGLALGVDTGSHLGALKADGHTIAVLGSGLKQIYPKQNLKLAERIKENGALVSEFALDKYPHKHNFPRRNRIISGLSLGVVVVEAAIRSGSLITARYAAEQGREVFAVPGSIQNTFAKGCHHLIRQGAKLTENVIDILEEFQFQYPSQVAEKYHKNTAGLNSVMRKFLQAVDFYPTSFDTIIRRSGLTAGEVSSMLLALELQNYVCIVPGGYVKLK